MIRSLLAALICCSLAANQVSGQAATRGEAQGTYLGALFGPIPDALYDHLPDLPRGQGVLITHVLPESPAARAPLKKNDILLAYDGRKVVNCEQFASLIQGDRPDRKVRLDLVRAGKSMASEVTLGRGPALKLAPSQRAAYQNNYQSYFQDNILPKGTAKGNGPAPVSINALPLDNDRMRVTIEYYLDGTGRLRSMTCEGLASEIDREVLKLPERERNLTRKALERIRELNSPRQQEKKDKP